MAPLRDVGVRSLVVEGVHIWLGCGLKLKPAKGARGGTWKDVDCHRVRVLSIFADKSGYKVKVQHLFTRADLSRDLQLNELPVGAAHELWVSDLEDTYDLETVVSSFPFYHYKILEATQPGEKPADLKARGIYMYRSTYSVRKGNRPAKINAAPKFPSHEDTFEWPLFDNLTFGNICHRIAADIQRALSPVQGGGRRSVRSFVPLSCLPALMELGWVWRACNVIIFFTPEMRVLDQLLQKGWNVKLRDHGFEKIKAMVLFETLKISYHFGRQTMTFAFNQQRQKWDREEEEWEVLDLTFADCENQDRFSLQVFQNENDYLGTVTVDSAEHALPEVREAITTQIPLAVPLAYLFLGGTATARCKILARNEKRYPIQRFLLDDTEGEIHITEVEIVEDMEIM